MEAAKAAYELALKEDADRFASRMALSEILADEGKFAEAAEHLELAQILEPDSYRVHYNLGGVLTQLGRTAEAETGLRRALSLSEENLGPDHDHTLRVHAGLGSHYLETGAPERARVHLELVLTAYETRLEADHPRLNEVRVDLGATLLALCEVMVAMIQFMDRQPQVLTVVAWQDDG